MKVAETISLVLAVVCVGFAASSSKEEFQRWEKAMVDHICANADRDVLLEKIMECEESYPAYVYERYDRCIKDTDVVKYFDEECSDEDAIQTYYTCMAPNFGDENFREQLLNSKDTLDCLLNTFKNYGVESDEVVLKDQ